MVWVRFKSSLFSAVGRIYSCCISIFNKTAQVVRTAAVQQSSSGAVLQLANSFLSLRATCRACIRCWCDHCFGFNTMSRLKNMLFAVGDADDSCGDVSVCACVPFKGAGVFTLQSHRSLVIMNVKHQHPIRQIQSEQQNQN